MLILQYLAADLGA